MKDEYKEMVCRVRFIDGVPAKTYLSDAEIVRCMDCKYYKTESYQEGRYVFTFCERDRERLIFDMNGDDYCSQAERREE